MGGTGAISCNIATFNSGATATFVLTVKVNGNTPPAGGVYAYSDYPVLAPGSNTTAVTGNVTVTYAFTARYLYGG